MKRARTADSVVLCGLHTPIIQFRTSGVPAVVTAVTEKPDRGVCGGTEREDYAVFQASPLSPWQNGRQEGAAVSATTSVARRACSTTRPYLEHALTKAAQAPAGAGDLLH